MSLSQQELSELNRYAVWMGRLSNSLQFMSSTVNALPVTPQAGSRHTVQERNKMMRLGLEDLKIELENLRHAINGLEQEYSSVREDFSSLKMSFSSR